MLRFSAPGAVVFGSDALQTISGVGGVAVPSAVVASGVPETVGVAVSSAAVDPVSADCALVGCAGVEPRASVVFSGGIAPATPPVLRVPAAVPLPRSKKSGYAVKSG